MKMISTQICTPRLPGLAEHLRVRSPGAPRPAEDGAPGARDRAVLGTRRHARGPQAALLPTAHARVRDLHHAGFPDAAGIGLVAARSSPCVVICPARSWARWRAVHAPEERRGARPGPPLARPVPLGTRGPPSRRLSGFQAESGNRVARRAELGARLPPAGVRAVREPAAHVAFSGGGEWGWQGQQASAAASEASWCFGFGLDLLPQLQRPLGERVTGADWPTGLPAPGFHSCFVSARGLPRGGGRVERPRSWVEDGFLVVRPVLRSASKTAPVFPRVWQRAQVQVPLLQKAETDQ